MATQDLSDSCKGHAGAGTEAHVACEIAESPVAHSTTAVNGDGTNLQTELRPPEGQVDRAPLADNEGVQEPVVSHETVACPSSPQQSDSKLARPDTKDEKTLLSYIAKAHAQVRDGSLVASSAEEQDRAVVKYAEMVSHMTLLLATLGVGRSTTVRALAYMSGPDARDVKAALRQAKLDRKEQNTKKRQTSEASGAPRKNEMRGSDTTSTQTSSNNSTDDSLSGTNPIAAASGLTSLTEMSVVETARAENQLSEPTKTKAVAEATDTKVRPTGAMMQKKRFSRGWWSKTRRRNHGTSEKANEETSATDKASQQTKESTANTTFKAAPTTVASPSA